MFKEEEDFGMQVDIILDKEWAVLWGVWPASVHVSQGTELRACRAIVSFGGYLSTYQHTLLYTSISETTPIAHFSLISGDS